MANLPLITQLPIPPLTDDMEVRLQHLEHTIETLAARIDEMVSFYNDTITVYNTTDNPFPSTEPPLDEMLGYDSATGITYLGANGVWVPLTSNPAPARAITATTALTDADTVIFANATSGAITVNLPTAVGRTGRGFWIWKTDASANAVTIDPAGAETISGSGGSGATRAITTQYENHYVISNGTNWYDWI